MTNELATQKYWESVTYTAKDIGSKIPFTNIFNTHIPPAHNSEQCVLEIGCVPGIYLGYIAHTFNYYPEGIDYIANAKTQTQTTLQKFGITNATIYEADFFTWNPQKQYDIVCSFGFIEHFKDVVPVIEKHVALLKKGGTLILEVPNFAHGQYVLHSFLDKDNLDRHNTNIMHRAFFEALAHKYNLTTKYLGYTGGVFDFWSENINSTLLQKLVCFMLRICAFIGRQIPISNKYFSPFLIFVATK